MIELRISEIIVNKDKYDSILEHVNKKPFPLVDGYGETVYQFHIDMDEEKFIWIRVHNHIGELGDLDYPCIVAQLMEHGTGSIGQAENNDPQKLFTILHEDVIYGVILRKDFSI